jgi:hypothetical protein
VSYDLDGVYENEPDPLTRSLLPAIEALLVEKFAEPVLVRTPLKKSYQWRPVNKEAECDIISMHHFHWRIL